VLLGWGWRVVAQAVDPLALVLTADGPVTPAMREYLKRGLRTAENNNASIVVFQLNTPGGSVSIMNEMVQEIRRSEIPVVVYVWPRGAMAGSAGTLITLAGHAAAMAPETIIGAASPVGSSGEDLGETMAAKEQNAILATIDTLMEYRPESARELARLTVSEARAASAREALEAGMIDFLAADTAELLSELDGFTLRVLDKEMTLDLAGVRTEALPISLIEQLLLMLTNPNIIFLLLSIGVQAILIEISSPGGWFAGFLGVICLALAAYGLGVLPVNYFGLVFLALAFVLFILDVKAPTHGALTTAGVASLVVGALVLFNSPGTPNFQRVSVPLVVLISMITAATFFTIISFAWRAQRRPVQMGQQALAGRTGVVRTPLEPEGTVQMDGELWTAELAEPGEGLPKGTRVNVVRAQGVRLFVKPASEKKE
jgi:membrane-bound serine protease (ClpP class)